MSRRCELSREIYAQNNVVHGRKKLRYFARDERYERTNRYSLQLSRTQHWSLWLSLFPPPVEHLSASTLCVLTSEPVSVDIKFQLLLELNWRLSSRLDLLLVLEWKVNTLISGSTCVYFYWLQSQPMSVFILVSIATWTWGYCTTVLMSLLDPLLALNKF